MKKIIRTTYQTKCGRYEYDTEDKCLEHDRIVSELDTIMSDLKWFKTKELEDSELTDRVYIAQDVNVFIDVRQNVLKYFYDLTHKKEFKVAFDSNSYFGVNFDHLIHVLEWTDYRYLVLYLFRLMNIDTDGKEYSRLYDLLHKSEFKFKKIDDNLLTSNIR